MRIPHILYAILLWLFPASGIAQTLLAGWDFQTNTNGGTLLQAAPNTPNVLVSNFGNATMYLDGSNASSAWITASSGNQLSAFSGTTLNAGNGFATSTSGAASLALINSTANGKCIVFRFSMSGYANLQLSYATQRTTTGFTTQQWEYSSDGLNWNAFQTINSLPTSFTVQTLNTLTALNNNPNAYLRLTFSGANNAAGNNRIDNIQFNVSPAPPVISNATQFATVGIPFSYSIQATGNPSSYAASNLPAGLSLNTTNGLISGTPLHAQAATSYNLSATNNGGSGNGLLTLSISPGIQTIQFPLLPTFTYGDTAYALAGSGGASGNSIVYNSSDSLVAQASGNFLILNGAGTCTITAAQAGNADYYAAGNVNQICVVNKAVQSIQFTAPASHLLNDAPFQLTASGGASGNPVSFSSSDTTIASITGNLVTVHQAGTCIITASQAGNNNYFAATSVSQSLTVNRIPQVILFNALPIKQLGDAPFQLSALGGGSGNAVIFSSSDTSVASVSGTTVILHAAGYCMITASQNGNAQYDAAADVSQVLLVNAGGSMVLYSFGTTTTPTALPTSGLPVNHLTFSAISQGNNANTTQTALTLTTTSASNNSGASGGMNAGITARNRSMQTDSSAYLEFTMSPASGYMLALSNITFNSRSTSTGPTTLDIRSNLNNYATSYASWMVNANSVWASQHPVLPAMLSSGPLTIRIYGYVTGGNGSINTGASPNNWRVDDISLTISLIAANACNMTLNLQAAPVLCHGGTTQLTATVTQGNGNILYALNGGMQQSNNTFNVSAGTYTVTATDGLQCSTTSTIIINDAPAINVTASNVNGCTGSAVCLQGYPSGGVFSVPNPYTGNSTSYQYTYTDSNGCVMTSAPASILMQPCLHLHLRLFIQGYYIGSGMMTSALWNEGVSNDMLLCDHLTIELRDATTFSMLASGDALLYTDGFADISFPAQAANAYIVVKHRNAIQTWSALPMSMNSGTVSYDFSTAATQAYGQNEVEAESGVWALYSGDLVADENIDLLDLPALENDVNQFNYGYYPTDLNGDGNMDLLDFPALEENIDQFVYAHHPVYISFPETFESGSKTSYTIGDVTLSTGSWNFDNALIGTSASDHKTAAAAARVQGTGKLTMNVDATIDTAYITVHHAVYGTDSASSWALYLSYDGGLSWAQSGPVIQSSSATLQAAVFPCYHTGTIRLQIRKLSGGRLNLDDIDIEPDSVQNNQPSNDPLLLGNPSNAVTDISVPDNYLLVKPQYDVAYNESNGSAAWVAWHLDASNLGTTPRCDCFTTDMQIPASFYRASSSAYTGTGFDRGHQTPSAQRNNSAPDNAATFLMSNIMPQSPNLNQITWAALEQYAITLVNAGYEIYTYSGGYGNGGTGSNGGITYTIGGGNIQVPSHYWKIMVVLPVGINDVSRVSAGTRVIAVDMPNEPGVSNHPWGYYRTTVDAIESATGFDFLSLIPVSVQNVLEAAVDNGPTN